MESGTLSNFTYRSSHQKADVRIELANGRTVGRRRRMEAACSCSNT